MRFYKEKVAIKDLLKIAVCSMFGVQLINFLSWIKFINSNKRGNYNDCKSIIVVVLSYFILREIITFKKIIGILLAMIGALILILQTGDMSINVGTRFGNLLVLINASSYALYLVLVRYINEKISSNYNCVFCFYVWISICNTIWIL